MRHLIPLLLLLALLAPAASAQPPEPNLRRTHVVRVFQANRDAVVNVNTTQIVRQRFAMFNDPIFRHFFPQVERDVRRTSLGSGFVIHPAGYVVTNAHVVEGADEIDIVLASGRHLPATVLASDAQQDLAILKIDPPDDLQLQTVTLGDSSDLMIGEPTVAIGNALGYQHSVTTGIISATDRALDLTADWKLQGLLQTDASINPGNSGGPLLNAYGQVIGINTAIRGDAQNIGFAIAVNRLRDLIPDLLSPLALNQIELGGRVIERRTITPPATVEVALLFQPREGPPVPFTHINDQPVTSVIDAYVQLLKLRVGQQARFTGGPRQAVAEARQAPLSDGQRLARSMLGLELRALTPAEAARLGVARSGGVLITSVERNGPGHRAGLAAGDVIVQLGRYRIPDLRTLALLLGEVGQNAAADLYVLRNGQLGRTRLTLRAPTADRL